MPVNGMANAKMMLVVKAPNWGVPEDSSNTEPTAAIAATQEPPNNTPLFGVTVAYLDILQPPASTI